MEDAEIHQAVLFALQTANRRSPSSVTSSILFTALPKCLRERWSPKYLSRYILRELESSSLIETHSKDERVTYNLTPEGARRLRVG